MKQIRPLNRFASCAISLTLVALVTTPSRAQDPKPNRITVHKFLDFIAAVDELSHLANVPIRVDPTLLKAGSKDQLQVPGFVGLNETDAPFEKALQDLMDTANTPLRFRLVKGVYRVERDPTRPYRPIISWISVSLRQPLENALQTLLRAANADPTIGYRMDPSLALARVDLSQRVRLQLENTSFETAMQTLLASANPPLTFTTALSNGNWNYVIKVDPTRKATPPTPKPPPPPDAISFSCMNVPFDEALEHLFRGVRTYRVDPAVTAYDEPVTLDADEISFDEALTRLLQSIKGVRPLTFRKENGIYTILPNPDPAAQVEASPARAGQPNGIEGHPITLSLKDAPMEEALHKLLTQVDASYLYWLPQDGGGHVTLTLQNVPFKQAIISLLRASDSRIHLRYELKDGLITVGRMRHPFDFTERGKGKVVAHLRKANALQVVTKLLFHYGPVSYTLDPALSNTTITADINGQTLDEALKIVRRGASSPIFIKVENGIYKFNPTPSLQDLQ